MLPSNNALFVFEAAARSGSFTAAAAELNVTQPAVSRMLGRFESYLGCACSTAGRRVRC
jgi:DNA-binding transcriptional LysR family regulator